MDAFLNSLASNKHVSNNDLEKLCTYLVDQLQYVLRVGALTVLDSKIDRTGAFPGIYCKLRSKAGVHPFEYEWCALVSLCGYDLDGSWCINACAHVFLFVNSKRIFSEGGELIRLAFQATNGKWQWVNEGWSLDEYDEFGYITEPFPA